MHDRKLIAASALTYAVRIAAWLTESRFGVSPSVIPGVSSLKSRTTSICPPPNKKRCVDVISGHKVNPTHFPQREFGTTVPCLPLTKPVGGAPPASNIDTSGTQAVLHAVRWSCRREAQSASGSSRMPSFETLQTSVEVAALQQAMHSSTSTTRCEQLRSCPGMFG